MTEDNCMDPEQLEQFLQERRKVLKNSPNDEKLRTFIHWCKQNNIEEPILRLSSEGKGGASQNYFLDFTTTRLIVTKKSFARKFLDTGYIAGLAPYPAVVINPKLKNKLDKDRHTFSSDELLSADKGNYFIWYSDINELTFKKGIESTIVNMFGRMIVHNFMAIRTAERTYEFKLPVNKNGVYERIFPWLSIVVPIRISIK